MCLLQQSWADRLQTESRNGELRYTSTNAEAGAARRPSSEAALLGSSASGATAVSRVHSAPASAGSERRRDTLTL